MAKKIDLQLPHIGSMLKVHLDKRHIDHARLARAMNKNRTTVWKYDQRDSLQLKILWHLCTVLKHNFFADIAAQLPADYTTNVSPDTATIDRMAQLESENRDLKMQLDLLKEVRGLFGGASGTFAQAWDN